MLQDSDMAAVGKRSSPGSPLGGASAKPDGSPNISQKDKMARLTTLKFQLSPEKEGGSSKDHELQTDSSSVNMLQDIEQLFKREIGPVRSSIESLERQMSELTVSVDERLKAIEARIDTNEIRIMKLEDLASKGQPSANEEAMSRTAAMEAQIADLSQQAAKGPLTEDRSCTAVVGGLGISWSMHEAEQWLKDKLWHIGGLQPVEVFAKGDFKGLLFAKFGSKANRDDAVSALQRAGIKEGDRKVWAKPDLPLEKRVVKAFVFGLKYAMVEKWGYNKSQIWVDPEEGALWVENEMAVGSVKVCGAELKVDFHNGWGDWLSDADFPQLLDLRKSLEAKLQSAGSGTKGDKGSGKGKGTAKGKSWAGGHP